jgi:hypothetical protein
MATVKGHHNWFRVLGVDGVLEFDRALADSRACACLPEKFVMGDPDPIKLDDVTILIKTLDGDIRI